MGGLAASHRVRISLTDLSISGREGGALAPRPHLATTLINTYYISAYHSWLHKNFHTQSLGDNQNIGEDDCSIQIKPCNWLQSDFTGQFWGLTYSEEVMLFSHFTKLGQIAAGLPHNPDGNTVYTLSSGCSQDSVIFKWRKVLLKERMIYFNRLYAS